MIDERAATTPGRSWRISRDVCALHDSQRHLGHVVKTDRWHAYDATHMNPQADGIRYIGDFSDPDTAMAAVEASVASQYESAKIPSWIF